MNQKNSSQTETDIYWNKLFNRIERALGWFFFVTGLIILVSYILYEIVLLLFRDTQLNLVLKFGLIFIIIGFVILIISVIREKMFISKKDKYTEVKQ